MSFVNIVVIIKYQTFERLRNTSKNDVPPRKCINFLQTNDDLVLLS